MKKTIIVSVLIFLLSTAISTFAYQVIPRYVLDVQDQPAGAFLKLNRLIVPQRVFVVAKLLSFNDRRWYASRLAYVQAGDYEDYYIDLIANDFLHQKPGMQLILTIIRDDGDFEYDETRDTPARTWYGKKISKKITLQ